MAIDIKDEEVPLTTLNKRNVFFLIITLNQFIDVFVDSTIDTPTALFNLLGELKR